ncbi:fatty-acid amide hydrolase 1 [Clonorchis sinensis]|uniref:Fatty-acid amide hydrolase 1 n=1 Tax=Clonorchis sinensis TaxID=79923 RepID=H2KPN8_CLOSI|nr:fatty-acid amide hydrolase 1 [Clonorchis sinensis]
MWFSGNHRQLLKGLLYIGGACVAYYWVSSLFHGFFMRREYARRRERKRQEKAAAKRAFGNYLNKHPMPEEDIAKITSKPFLELVHMLKSGQLTPERVLLAYQHKAFEVDARCNCVIEFLYPDFSEINLNGPFSGVPISLKDNYSVKGCESYAGMACHLTGPADKDSVMVTVLKSLGAVPFVRTGVPQAMLSVLSSNPIDGTVLNPLDLSRSPAGSSSGEGALVGGGGSILGFGTDLGGSIRLPAAMCNCVGFKPTPSRLSKRLMLNTNRFMTTDSSCGPIAREVDTCITLMKALFDSPLHHELDYFGAPLCYSTSISTDRRLRIGYFVDDGSTPPVPAAQRAVLVVKDKLAALGHELVPWQPPVTGTEWLKMFLTTLVTDGGMPLLQALRYDVVQPPLNQSLKIYKSWWITRYFQQFIARLLGRHTELQLMQACCAVHDIPSLMQHLEDLKAFRQRIYDHWNQERIDAVICPAFGMAAPILAKSNRKFTEMLTYLNLFNVTNMPAGCLPSGISVDENDIEALKNSAPPNGTGSPWSKDVIELQADTLGFRVSVQVAAAPWRDELCLHVMKEVEKAVRL